MTTMTQDVAYLTGDLPGVGGRLKARPEDFLVEELPLYEPCGEGEHLYLFIEKREKTTMDVVRRLSKMFAISKRNIGYAGLKDKRAVTRQMFSVHLPDPEKQQKGLERFVHTPLKLLWHDLHTNKLKRGHLKGNRFVIYIREVNPAGVTRVKPILDVLEKQGFPNYIGEQRFGYRQNNHLLGRDLLLKNWQAFLDGQLGQPDEKYGQRDAAGRQAYVDGRYDEALKLWPKSLKQDRQALAALQQGKSPEEAAMFIDRQHRQFVVSALQSAVFNRVLDQRLRAGTFARLLPGDLAMKQENGACFEVDQAVADEENAPGGRVERMEVSPTGPMWGPEMQQPKGDVLKLEVEALEHFGLSLEQLIAAEHATMSGIRRSLRVPLIDPDLSAGSDDRGPYIRVAFELPKGSFATTALREIMKPQE